MRVKSGLETCNGRTEAGVVASHLCVRVGSSCGGASYGAFELKHFFGAPR